MDLFKYDSPFWTFVGTITDLAILNLLCLICCIPIITIGPALCAKYDVAMRIVRREEPAVIRPFFKAFKANFKQALIAWLFLLAACALLMIDWTWMYEKGWDNVSSVYFAGAAFVTIIVSFMIMTVFPIIARFELSVAEAFKTAALFSMIYFIGLFAIVVLIVCSAIFCVQYFRMLPLILVLSHLIIVFCLCLILQRGFQKLEARFVSDDDEKKDDDTLTEK